MVKKLVIAVVAAYFATLTFYALAHPEPWPGMPLTTPIGWPYRD
jgi:hypothetical protein